jgi:hypothetical protein
MAKFWLATFGNAPAAPLKMTALDPTISPSEPLLAAGNPPRAIEIIENKGEYAVLFSIVDNPDDPKTFWCRIGFANGAKPCAVWSDRGFPLGDAIIAPTEDNGLKVRAPCFLEKDPVIQYEHDLASITKLPQGQGGDARDSSELAQTEYKQTFRGPDVVSPGTQVEAKAVTWSPKGRSNVKEWKDPQSTFEVKPSRYFRLAPFTHEAATPKKMWSGNIELPVWGDQKLPDEKVVTMSRADTFGVAAFQFEDVEVLGFRIDPRDLGFNDEEGLAKLTGLMDELVKPLNFHLDLSDEFSAVTRSAVSDFRFSAATYTVIVELLRYGKMKQKKPMQPLKTDDVQSQHELIARILVGRVDDDTAQARDPATFVPTIFVDNSWSKILGRNVQGFDKRMANFSIGEKVLRPDGRLAKDDKDPQPLGSITKIALAATTGGESGATLLKLDCPHETIKGWDAFVKVDPQLALAPVSVAPMSWLQTDFDGPEYRRAFARSVINNRFREYSSIQVSPVGAKHLKDVLQKQSTWITGTIKFGKNMLFAQPTGTIGLTFNADPSAPLAWRNLCKLFGIDEGKQGKLVMPTGTWYRTRCSLDMTIKNALD